MAGNHFPTIEVIDLSHVCGGVDKQTAALQAAIDQAISAVTDVAKATAPKQQDATSQALFEMLGKRGSRSGSTPAPALPPTSTLSR